MATIPANSPLNTVAEILQSAMLFGRNAWLRSPNEPSGPVASQTLSDDLTELFMLLNRRGVSYLLVGGVALLKYIDGRNTEDVDLVLSLKSLKTMPEIEIASQDRNFARGRFKSIRVDVLLAENPVFRLAAERFATTHAFRELQVRCATVEGLTLLKLYALPSLYLQGNSQRVALYEGDLRMLMDRYRPATEPLLDVLAPHFSPGTFSELRNIVSEIERSIARTDKAKHGDVE